MKDLKHSQNNTGMKRRSTTKDFLSVVDKILWTTVKNLGKSILALYYKINNSLIFVASSWFHSTEEGMLPLENEFYL